MTSVMRPLTKWEFVRIDNILEDVMIGVRVRFMLYIALLPSQKANRKKRCYIRRSKPSQHPSQSTIDSSQGAAHLAQVLTSESR